MLRLTTTNKLPADFVLVAMDKSSLRLDGLDPEEIDQSRAFQLMKAGYPWSREVYALFIDRVMEAGARMVILDLVLATSRPGRYLAKVLLKYQGRIVLASRFDFIGQNNVEYTPPAPAFAGAAPEAVGYANFPHWFTTTRELLLYATAGIHVGKNSRVPSGSKAFFGHGCSPGVREKPTDGFSTSALPLFRTRIGRHCAAIPDFSGCNLGEELPFGSNLSRQGRAAWTDGGRVEGFSDYAV